MALARRAYIARMTRTVRNRRGLTLAFPLVLFAAALAGCQTAVSDKNIKVISTQDVKSLFDRARAGEPNLLVLIDARPPERFAEGHLPGARNMTLPPIEAGGKDPALTPYEHLVVTGDNPADALARAMTKRLLQLRYKGVRLYAGGLEEWKRMGYPVETGVP